MSLTKSILITGCSSGIGLCVANGLRDMGYRVFATARKVDDVRKLQDKGFESIQLDLCKSQSIKKAVEEILAMTEGKLYALFNNGAYGQPGAVEDLRRDVLKDQFEANVFGWLELTNQIIPVMREQGYGRIIQNSSLLGLVALPYRGAYNASKYAIEGLTDTLRMELAGTGIKVSLIEPGPIESKFRENAYKAFKENVSMEDSPHHEQYLRLEDRLAQEGPPSTFTLPSTAVLKKVIHALESPKPKVRYYVTFPTYICAFLKRVLPHSWLDKILTRI